MKIVQKIERVLPGEAGLPGQHHTFGDHSICQMWSPGKTPINNLLMPWCEPIHQPGAAQMQHGRTLMESCPFLTLIPDDPVMAGNHVPTAMPGAGRYRFMATGDESGSSAKVKSWWFNPRDRQATAFGEFPNTGRREFTRPDQDETLDWVLVLDDAATVPSYANQFTKP